MCAWRKKLNSIARQTRERFDAHAPDERYVLKFRILRFCSNLHTHTDRDIFASLKRKYRTAFDMVCNFLSKIIIVYEVNVLPLYFQKASTGRPFTGYFYCSFFLYRHEFRNFRFRLIFSALPHSTAFSSVYNTFIERRPLFVPDNRFSSRPSRETQYPQIALASIGLAKIYDTYRINYDMKTRKCYGLKTKSRHYCRRRHGLRDDNRNKEEGRGLTAFDPTRSTWRASQPIGPTFLPSPSWFSTIVYAGKNK